MKTLRNQKAVVSSVLIPSWVGVVNNITLVYREQREHMIEHRTLSA